MLGQALLVMFAAHLCGGQEEVRTRATRDGSVYVFDPSSKGWRLQAAQVVFSPSGPLLALPGRQFDYRFDGDFCIDGVAVVFGAAARRESEERQHGDTADSVWDGTVVLAKVLEKNPGLVRGRRVLELGSGRGVCGISAARLGARSVTLTDLPYALGALQEAVALNSVDTCGELIATVLDWSDPRSFLDGAQHFDVILASDVAWLMELVQPLVDTIDAVCSQAAAQVLVMHQTRSLEVETAFLAGMALQFDLEWELRGGVSEFGEPRGAPVEWDADHVPNDKMRLWSFRKAGS